MKLQQMIEQVQKHHPDLGTVEIINLLNQASDEFCQRTLILDEATKFNTVANQRYYGLKDSIIEHYKLNYKTLPLRKIKVLVYLILCNEFFSEL